jgi:2,3-bisphosphoglycerate-independent phosphoglycerate mutase
VSEPAWSPLAGVRRVPVVLAILDGVGRGRGDDTDAVASARTPNLDRLLATAPHGWLAAHGRAVGLPSDADMGNSEVGHNAMGAGRVLDQGAMLVEAALSSGAVWDGAAWKEIVAAGRSATLHVLGLLSDGNVHAHVEHLRAVVARAAAEGVGRIRVHVLSDGRDVSERSVLTWLAPLEAWLATLPDARVASGGGRMHITMDRYEADWPMVKRGWDCHVHGVGRAFPSACDAVHAFYDADPKINDQWLPAFVVTGPDGAPAGRIADGDAVVLVNFRGDRALEISRCFEAPSGGTPVPIDLSGPGGAPAPRVTYAGMMQYDGDLRVPARFLVAPPAIDRTVGQYLAAAGRRSFVVSETQKFGHATYFFNGNRSGLIDPALERYEEVPSDRVPFEQAPAMQAHAITARAVEAVRSGRWDHVRLNLANGDMVGHTGDFAATVAAVETVDACVGELEAAVREAGGVLVVTADHGNADLMVELDGKGRPIEVDGRRTPRTSHSLNPVPVILVDASGQWDLHVPDGAGIASLGATVLALCGIDRPEGYLPSLVSLRADAGEALRRGMSPSAKESRGG